MGDKTKRSIAYNGKSVSFRSVLDGTKFIKAYSRHGNVAVCPICKTKFEPITTGAVVLIVSNQVGIPNRIVHQECIEDKTDEYAFRIIANDWKAAQQYRDWFVSD